MLKNTLRAAAAALMLVSALAQAQAPWVNDPDAPKTRYLAMGDSLAAGQGAIPATQGYAYLLYQGATFDRITHTLFANSAVPGANSADVLAFQVPQAVERFQPGLSAARPGVITLSVGGNDLLAILADPTQAQQVIAAFQANLTQTLGTLRARLPAARIIVGNQYDIPEITADVPGADQIIAAFNQIIAGVAAATGAQVADVFGAFQGRTGLLLVERHGADQFEVHPTNAGYRVMAQAFAAAM